MNTTSSINYALTKKRLKMMGKTISAMRAFPKMLLAVSILSVLTLISCTETEEWPDYITWEEVYDRIPPKIYHVPELHYDGNRSKELGIPLALGAQFTSSGELFSGTQKVYVTENDSLWMELFFKEGINTGSVMYSDGDTTRQVHGIYKDRRELAQKMYFNGTLVYDDIRPRESEDSLGHVRNMASK